MNGYPRNGISVHLFLCQACYTSYAWLAEVEPRMGGEGRILEFWPRIAYNLIVIRLGLDPAKFLPCKLVR